MKIRRIHVVFVPLLSFVLVSEHEMLCSATFTCHYITHQRNILDQDGEEISCDK